MSEAHGTTSDESEDNVIQYRLTTLPTSYDCSATGDQLSILLDNGYPKINQGATLKSIALIEVYVSGSSGPFKIIGTELGEDTYVGEYSHVSVPSGDSGRVTASRDRTNKLVLEFTPPSQVGTEHAWSFNPDTPPLRLTVKVKRQENANSGACSNWAAILPT